MATNTDSQLDDLTYEELLRRATDLVPVLKSRSSNTEEIRRIPSETVQDFLSAGIHRIGVPPRFGGLDLDYGLSLEISAELARGCGASSWCYALWSAHSYLVGHWPLEAQEEVFGDGPDALCSSSLNVGKSTTQPVSGGYRLSGRWEFSSGCDSADWVMLGLHGISERAFVLVPRSDFEIIDNWFVSGLRGSGSKDIVVEDAFIPSHRVLDVEGVGDGSGTGWELHGQDRYRMPIPVLMGWDLVAPAIGIAQSMIDEFTARIIGTSGPGRTADSPAIHLRLSEASAEVDAGMALMRSDIREMFEIAHNGDPFTPLDRARFRRDKAFVTQLGLRAVNRLFDLSGGHALFDSVAIQRIHRDMHAVAHRDGLIMDLGGQQYGRVALGLDPDQRI